MARTAPGPNAIVRGKAWSVSIAVCAIAGALGCTPASVAPAWGEDSPAPSRTLNILTRAEPATLAWRAPRNAGGASPGVSVDSAVRPFNAGLDILDSKGEPSPYLAEALPVLNTDTWRVLPDGRMETSYRLKSGVTWHDGVSLSAQDFVFGFRIYVAPEFGASLSPTSLIGSIGEVTAPDARSLVIRWKSLFPQAGTIMGEQLPPLPTHILEPALLGGAAESFLAQPFWNTQYVGLGPYRLEHWEPGAFIQGAAFDGHIWGKPKIERIALRFSPDENTALANLLSKAVHLASDRSIRFEQAVILKGEWRGPEDGVTLLTPTMSRRTHIQVRPEFATPPGLRDARVRKALAYAVDKDTLNDGLFNGLGVMTPSLIRPTVSYYAEIERAVAKYPFDLRRSEQLMAEAGYTKVAIGGTYVNAAGEPFRMELSNQAGTQPERETAIMIDTWRRAGFDVYPNILRPPASGDPLLRATFPGAQTASGGEGTDEMPNYAAGQNIGTAPRWGGSNRGGWSDPDYDRLYEAYQRTLDRNDRVRLLTRMMVMVNEELPMIPLFMNFGVSGYLGSLVGPDPSAVDDTYITWNIHEWTLK